jgi:hypothetical protein
MGVLIPMFGSHLLPLPWRALHRKHCGNPANRAPCHAHAVLYSYTGRKNQRQLQWITFYYYGTLLSVTIDCYQLLLIIMEPGTRSFTKSYYIVLYMMTVLLLQHLLLLLWLSLSSLGLGPMKNFILLIMSDNYIFLI